MMRYRPVKRGRPGYRRVNVKRLGTFIGVAAAAVVVIVLSVNFFSKADDSLPGAQTQGNDLAELGGDGVFDKGVTVAGVDVAGMSMQEAQAAVAPVVTEMLDTTEVSFSVKKDAEAESEEQAEGEEGEEGEEAQASASPQSERYSVSLANIGFAVELDSVLDEAIKYTPQEGQAKDFPLAYTMDEAVITEKLEELAERDEWGKEPINSGYRVLTTEDEDKLTTYGELVETDNEDGYRIKTEELAASIMQQAETGQFAEIEAPVEVLPAKDATENRGEIHRIATATTSFDDKVLWEKQYNVWKMSTIMNGAVFYPGESYSVNEAIGPRTEERGWKVALGIEEGVYTPQYGGGVCQLSSTLYNATLKAEMKMLKRLPHTIKAKYVKPGLDATISTDGPDFVFENPYEIPLYLVVKCDVPANTVTTEIWGTLDRDYYIELKTERVEGLDDKVPNPEIVVNSSLNPYAVNRVRPGQGYEMYKIYKRQIDGDGNPLSDWEEIGKSEYRAISPKFEVGSSVPYSEGMTYEQLLNAAKGIAGENNETPPPSDDIIGDNGDGGDNGGGDNGGGDNGGGDNGGGDNGGGDNSGGGDGGGGTKTPEPPAPPPEDPPEDPVAPIEEETSAG